MSGGQLFWEGKKILKENVTSSMRFWYNEIMFVTVISHAESAHDKVNFKEGEY